MIDPPSHHEQQIGEPVDIPNQHFIDRRLQCHNAPFRTAADRPRDVQCGAGLDAAREDKMRERGQIGLEPIDQLLEAVDIGVMKGRFRDAGRNPLARIGEPGAKRKQIALNLDQRLAEVGEPGAVRTTAQRRQREPDEGVELVGFAVRVDTGVALRDAGAAKERSLTAVAGARVDFHDARDGVVHYMTAKRARKPARRPPPPALPAPADRRRFRDRLLTWYRRHGRDLPWRKTGDPYHILVSEIMLQQTQVDRVLPKYTEWIDKYPSLEALARAPEREVTDTWYPLGYNIRPKRLQTIARESVARYGGRLPADEQTLLSFKGIGAYTAGAIRSFAFRERAAILDTNVARLLFRVFVGNGDPKSHAMKRHLWRVSEALVPVRHVFDFNQALMDLGAMVCVARNPKCLVCPMAKSCRAFPFNADKP